MPDYDAPFPDDADTPDDGDGGDDTDDTEDADGDTPHAVLVSTSAPVPIRVSRIDDERAPEGTCLGTFIGNRLVARCAYPPEAIDHLVGLHLFSDPVPLALFAYEEEPGLQCRLFALVPAAKLTEAEHADEPWKSSVPSYERSLAEQESADADDEEGEPTETILLGNIVRFARDRRFGDNLAAEAVDILQKIIGGGPLSDASSKAIDDLLDSL
jgi:hypothetical protein